MEIIPKYKVIIVILFVLGFYMFFIRPAIIRRNCSKEMTKKWIIEDGIREANYNACVREKGVKE